MFFIEGNLVGKLLRFIGNPQKPQKNFPSNMILGYKQSIAVSSFVLFNAHASYIIDM